MAIPGGFMPSNSHLSRPWILEVWQDGRWHFVLQRSLSGMSSYIRQATGRVCTAEQRLVAEREPADDWINRRRRNLEVRDPVQIRVYHMVTGQLRWQGCWSEFDGLAATSAQCRPFAGRRVEDPGILAMQGVAI